MKNKASISKQIDRIRKIFPTMLAKQIVDVQPMSGIGVFSPYTSEIQWGPWRKTTSLWPRRSVTGKIIFGRINKRGYTNWQNSGWNGPGNPKRIHQFATDKELFEARLKDSDHA